MKLSFSGNSDGLHAGLRVVAALVAHCPSFVAPRFDSLCDAVLLAGERHGGFSVAGSPSKLLVRATVTRTLPVLAAFAPDAFARRYLRPALSWLTRDAHGSEAMGRRAASLAALGAVCRAMGDQLLPHVDDLVKLVNAIPS